VIVAIAGCVLREKRLGRLRWAESNDARLFGVHVHRPVDGTDLIGSAPHKEFRFCTTPRDVERSMKAICALIESRAVQPIVARRAPLRMQRSATIPDRKQTFRGACSRYDDDLEEHA